MPGPLLASRLVERWWRRKGVMAVALPSLPELLMVKAGTGSCLSDAESPSPPLYPLFSLPCRCGFMSMVLWGVGGCWRGLRE